MTESTQVSEPTETSAECRHENTYEKVFHTEYEPLDEVRYEVIDEYYIICEQCNKEIGKETHVRAVPADCSHKSTQQILEYTEVCLLENGQMEMFETKKELFCETTLTNIYVYDILLYIDICQYEVM